MSKIVAYSYDNISLVGKNGDKWLVNIKNTYGRFMQVQYNTKMCFEGDAKNWKGLVDVSAFYLSAGETRLVEIKENGFAHFIAISFVDSDNRYVRYAKDINVDGSMSVYNNTIYTYLTLSNGGKTGSSWKINISNPTSKSFTIYYNKKMCNKYDAENWANLNNVISINIASGKTQQAIISENWFATTIAISYITNGRRVISYADGLNTSGGINVMYKQ